VWHKELRCGINTLANRKLSKQIREEDYVVQRVRAKEQLAECQRRRTLLLEEILCREQ
jgi:hypothetical protein